jgi:hypothetical protein
MAALLRGKQVMQVSLKPCLNITHPWLLLPSTQVVATSCGSTVWHDVGIRATRLACSGCDGSGTQTLMVTPLTVLAAQELHHHQQRPVLPW